MTNGENRLIARKYRLREVLGVGGLGVVWRAHDESLGRDVAIKEVRPPIGVDAEQVTALYTRTLREARAAAKLADPGIVVVHEVVHEDGRPWIVMELVQGRTLQQIIDQDGRQPPRRAAELGCKILAGLRAVHQAGIVHRDIKPSNIMFDGERTVLTDFGVAALDGSTVLTMTGAVLGTPAFMSPEQAHARAVTPASDLWSLGATLYATVEGHPPFEGESVAAVIAALLANEPPPPVHAGPLGPVIAALMVTDPGARMPADELAARLARIASGGDDGTPLDVEPRRAPEIPRVVPWYRRRTPIVAALGVIAVAATVIPVVVSHVGHSATSPVRSHARRTASPSVPAVRLGTVFPATRLDTRTNVFTVAFSPDGSTLAAGGSNHRVLLWDPRRHVQKAQLLGHTDSVEQVTFSRDGTRLATAADDRTVRLWDLKSSTQIAKFTGHTSSAHSVAFSPDGTILASGAEDGKVLLWSLSTHAQTAVLTGSAKEVWSVAYSPDGRTVAGGGSDHKIVLYDARTSARIAALGGHTARVDWVAFSPDGKTLASGGEDKSVRLWDLTR